MVPRVAGMLARLSPSDRFLDLCRTLAGDGAPDVVHVRGARELRRVLVAAALTGAPTRIVASLRPGEAPSPPGLWRRADAVLVDPSGREAARRAGLEPARLRGREDPEAALRDVHRSHRRRMAYRRRLERRNRVRRAMAGRALTWRAAP